MNIQHVGLFETCFECKGLRQWEGLLQKSERCQGKFTFWRGEIKKTFKGGGEETFKGAKVNNFKDGQIEPDWQIELMGFYINMYFKICSMKLMQTCRGNF